MKNLRYFLLIALLLVFSSTLLAQNTDSPSTDTDNRFGLSYREFRVAFVPGISSNGIDAPNYAAKYSFNILAGYNGALKNGFELGGLLNLNKYYAEGVQIAGIGNYSGEETAGVQLSGVFNVSRDDMQGVQITGVANYADDDMQGIQIAGAVNWTGGTYQGLLFSGAVNLAEDDMQGLLFAGAANITKGNMQGIVASGAVNYAGRDAQGILAAGLLNYSEYFQGIAAAPLNVTSEFQGIQSGVLNVADYGQGLQIGVINYAKSFEGVPVGLISYYEDGRSEMDLWTSDGGFTNVGVKLGTDDIYNMISIGFNPTLENDVWQLGWSIGRLREYKNHFRYSDFSYFKVNEGNWTNDLNSLFKYRLLLGKDFGKGFQVYGGPTFNLMISRVESSNRYTWYRLLDYDAKGRNYAFWIGYSVGVELF